MSKPIIFAIHGLGGHGSWFERLKLELEKFNIDLYAIDLPGFGKNHDEFAGSSYKKGHIDDFQEWIDFVQAEYQELKRKNPAVPITILGHSLGAVIATCMGPIAEGDQLIISVPGYKGADDTFKLSFVLTTLWKLVFDKAVFGKDLYVQLPASPKKHGDPTDLDPLKVSFVTQTLLFQIMKMGWTLKQASTKLDMPVFMIQIKDDAVVDNASQDQYFNCFPSRNKVKTTYSGADHDWIWSEQLGLIAADIAKRVVGNP